MSRFPDARLETEVVADGPGIHLPEIVLHLYGFARTDDRDENDAVRGEERVRLETGSRGIKRMRKIDPHVYRVRVGRVEASVVVGLSQAVFRNAPHARRNRQNAGRNFFIPPPMCR